MELPKSRKFLLALVIIAVPTGLYIGSSFLVPAVSAFSDPVNTVLNRLVSVCCSLTIAAVCFAAVKLLLKRKIGITKKNFSYGFLSIGWIMLIYTLINFLETFPFSNLRTDLSGPALLLELAMTLIGCLEVGLVEESIWRVLSVNLFLWVFGEEKGGRIAAVIFSSVLFGLTHAVNLLATPSIPVATATQVIYAFILGFFFAVIYVRSGNILPAILHHALFDYACFAAYCFYPKDALQETVTTDIPLSDAALTLLCYLPVLLYSIWVFRGRRKKEKVS